MLRLGFGTVSLALMSLAFSGCGGDDKKPATSGGGSAGAPVEAGQAGLGGGGTAGAGVAGGSSAGSASLGGAGQGGSAGAGGAGGATCKVLKAGETGPHGLIKVHDEPLGKVLTPAGVENGQVYFGADSQLWAAPVAGGMAKSLGELYGEHELVQGGKVYAVSLQSTEPARKLFSAPITDLATQTTLADGIESPYLLVADETSLYYDGPENTSIFQVPLTGGTPVELVPGAEPHGMITRGGFLYWIDRVTKKLERVPAAGGPREPLLTVHYGGPMAATDTAIFWIDTTAHSIEKWEMGATTSQVLTKTLVTFGDYQGLAVSGDTVFFAFGLGCGYVYSVKDDGTGEELFAPGVFDAKWVGATDSAVFVLGGTGVYRADR